MKVDLRTCVPGQLLKDGRGRLLEYKESIYGDNSSFDRIYYKHLLRYQVDSEDGDVYDETFTDNGVFDVNSRESHFNIVEILPLDKPEQPKSDKHPSVAWWESCPWITDRRPTAEDADYLGQVIQQLSSEKGATLDSCFISCACVEEGEAWIHSLNWKPLKQTPREKALALITKHKDSSTVGVWVPTPDEWDIIREGLTE